MRHVFAAAQPVDRLLVRRDHAAAGAGFDRQVAHRHAAFHVERLDDGAGIFERVAGAAREAERGDDGQGHVLAGDARLKLAFDIDAHGFRLALGQALGGQDVADFRGADAEGNTAEGTVGRGVTVAANDGEARLGQAHFRADDVDDAAVFGIVAEEADAVLRGILFKGMNLNLRLFGDIRAIALRVRAQGRNRVIERREGSVGAAHFQAARIQFGKRLGRGDFVDEVQVDIEHGRLVGGFGFHDVGVPHFFKQGFGHRISTRFRLALRPPRYGEGGPPEGWWAGLSEAHNKRKRLSYPSLSPFRL